MISYRKGIGHLSSDYYGRRGVKASRANDSRDVSWYDYDDRDDSRYDRDESYDMPYDDSLDAPEYDEYGPRASRRDEDMSRESAHRPRAHKRFDDQFDSVIDRRRPHMQDRLHQMLETYIDTQFKEEENENYSMIDTDIFSLAHMGLAFYVEQFSAQTFGNINKINDDGDISCLVKVYLDSYKNNKINSKLKKRGKRLG